MRKHIATVLAVMAICTKLQAQVALQGSEVSTPALRNRGMDNITPTAKLHGGLENPSLSVGATYRPTGNSAALQRTVAR